MPASGGGATQLLLLLLGAVGLSAITLVPWRVFKLMIGNVSIAWRLSLLGRVLASVAVAACIALLVVWLQVVSRVARCLLDSTQCGAGVASGWLYLALLGAGYLAFELACWPLRRALRNIGAVAPA